MRNDKGRETSNGAKTVQKPPKKSYPNRYEGLLSPEDKIVQKGKKNFKDSRY